VIEGRNDGEFCTHSSTPADSNRSIFIKSHFGGTSPFKVQVNFDIPIFEVQIVADALENG